MGRANCLFADKRESNQNEVKEASQKQLQRGLVTFNLT